MIRKIIMSNIKGQNSEQQLTGKDIIIGPNGAGKTTRMQSIGLSVLGYVPEKGKTLADTFELASSDTMAVRIETDDFDFQREFVKSSKLGKYGDVEVKITQNIAVSPSQGESTNKQKEARIKAEMGDFPAMLDFGAFIGLTDNKKRDFIYNLSGNQFSWDRDRVSVHLHDAVITNMLQETNPEMCRVMQKNWEDVMKQYKPDAFVQDGLLAMMEYAKDRLSYWKKEKITADGTAKKLTEIKNRAKDTDRELASNQEKLKELQAEREAIIQEIAKAASHNQIIAEKSEELKKLQEEIAAMADSANDAEKLEEAMRLEVMLEEYIDEKKKEISEEEGKVVKSEEFCQDAVKIRDAAKDEKNAIKARIGEINATIKAKSELIEKIVDNSGYCAFSKDIPCAHDFSDFIAAEQAKIDEMYETLDELNHKSNEAEEKQQKYEEKAKDMESLAEGYREFVADAQVELEDALKNLESTRETIRNLENKAPILTSKRDQEAQIKAYIEENPHIDLSDIEERKAEAEQKIEALTTTIDQQKKIRNDIINIKANIIDSQTATYEQECWKQIVEAIGQKGIQGKIVKEMLDPFREDIDKKLAEIGINKRFFFDTESDTGKEIFRFGWCDYDDKRPFDALSQGEQLLLMIALMTTIIEKNDPPVKILAIDNINDLDQKNMSKVIRGLNVAGTAMDNIILSGVATPFEEDTEGWAVWNLEEEHA